MGVKLKDDLIETYCVDKIFQKCVGYLPGWNVSVWKFDN